MDLPLMKGILNYAREKNISFCMPGHKGGRGFQATKEGREFLKAFMECDITEVDGVDNLHHPEGIIRDALSALSSYYGSYKSYFLVNGSTSGNLAMIFSAFDEGDKIIVERNCHRSVMNGIIMRKLQPVYVKNRILERYNAPLSIDMEHFLNLIDENKDAKGILLTYPNYYGVCCDLKAIIEAAGKYGMKVLVDGAHGAHFGACENLPANAVELGADMVVMSAHKTLPSFTQTAFLHINKNADQEKTDFYVSAFTSTSPSYLFMCSMDYARCYLEKYGKEDYEALLKLCVEYREKINAIKGFHVVSKEDVMEECKCSIDLDETRYVLNVDKGHSAHLLLKHLRESGIQAEMSDENNVVLIFSPFNERKDFESLYNELRKCNLDNIKHATVQLKMNEIPKMKHAPCQANIKKKRKALLDDSANFACGNSIVPYPPGIPILIMGEVVDTHAIDMIKYYLNNEVTVLGVDDGMITLLDE